MLDRPVEFVRRDVVGLPNGSYKTVERAFDELVDEGCPVIFGPYVSDNVVPLREHVDKAQRERWPAPRDRALRFVAGGRPGRNNVSSTAISSGAPVGVSRPTTRPSIASPTWSRFQRAEAKNRCARA